MKTQRTWPVLSGLLVLLTGALWLELSSQAATVSPQVIVIGNTQGRDDAAESMRWYQDDAINETHERARQLALRGEFAPALEVFAELRASHPDRGSIWAESGHWARRSGDQELALTLLERAMQLSPNIPSIQLDRAAALEAVGNSDQARQAYQAALSARPQHTLTRLLYARLLTKARQLPEAIEILSPAVSAGSNEERARALVARGRVRILAGQLEAARGDLTAAIERAPALGSTWQGAASALLDSSAGSDHETALIYANKAISLSPEDASARSLLGRIYERQGKPIEALDAYRECLRLDSQYEFARKRALRIALDSDDFPDARRHASVLLSQYPQDRESHFLAGLVESHAGQGEASRKHYQTAINVAGGEYPEAFYNLGLLESALDNNEAAIASYQRALELRPDYATAWNNLGVVLSKAEHPDQALAAFERALELEPSLSSAWRNLAKHLGREGKHKDAVAAYKNEVFGEISPG